MNQIVINALKNQPFQNINEWSFVENRQRSKSEWTKISEFKEKYSDTIFWHSFNENSRNFKNLKNEFSQLELDDKLGIIKWNPQFTLFLKEDEMTMNIILSTNRKNSGLEGWVLFGYYFYLTKNPIIIKTDKFINKLLKTASINQKFKYLKEAWKKGKKYKWSVYKCNPKDISRMGEPYVNQFDYVEFCLLNFPNKTQEIENLLTSGNSIDSYAFLSSFAQIPKRRQNDFLKKNMALIKKVQKYAKEKILENSAIYVEEYDVEKERKFQENLFKPFSALPQLIYFFDDDSEKRDSFDVDVQKEWNIPSSYLYKLQSQLRILEDHVHYIKALNIQPSIETPVEIDFLKDALNRALASLKRDYYSLSLELLHITLEFLSEKLKVNQFTKEKEIIGEMENAKRIIKKMSIDREQALLMLNMFVLKHHVNSIKARDNIAHYNHKENLTKSAVALIWLSCNLAFAYWLYTKK